MTITFAGRVHSLRDAGSGVTIELHGQSPLLNDALLLMVPKEIAKAYAIGAHVQVTIQPKAAP